MPHDWWARRSTSPDGPLPGRSASFGGYGSAPSTDGLTRTPVALSGGPSSSGSPPPSRKRSRHPDREQQRATIEDSRRPGCGSGDAEPADGDRHEEDAHDGAEGVGQSRLDGGRTE